MSEPHVNEMPPRERRVDDVRVLADGWYVVDIAHRRNNPVHRAVMRVSCRGAIAVIVSSGLEDPATRAGACHYLRVVRDLDVEGGAA